jgi:uncharacterized protein YndB with AHSA1/START domain
MEARSGELTLEMKRILPAAPELVFTAFTDPSELAKWWGPEGFSVPNLKFEARSGESYRIEMQPPTGDPFHLNGEVREVDPPARLAYTFAWEPAEADDVETLVSLAFRDLGGSTEVALTQRHFKNEARLQLHRDGWRESFDKLERLIALRPGERG